MKNNFKTAGTDNSLAFWSVPAEQQLKQLSTTPQGLSQTEASRRVKRFGANRLNGKKESGNIALFFAQFKNSIILILLFATAYLSSLAIAWMPLLFWPLY